MAVIINIAMIVLFAGAVAVAGDAFNKTADEAAIDVLKSSTKMLDKVMEQAVEEMSRDFQRSLEEDY